MSHAVYRVSSAAIVESRYCHPESATSHPEFFYRSLLMKNPKRPEKFYIPYLAG